MLTRTAFFHPLFALSVALGLAACTLPTKLGELSAGDEAADSTTTTGAQPTTTGAHPINSGGADSSGDSTAGPCNQVTLTRTPLSPNVVLVLDKSGSMVADPIGLWDHDADPNTADVTRWSSLHEVVETIVTDFDGSINFGAHLFPGPDATNSYDGDACIVDATIDVAVAAMNKDAVLAGIPAEDAVDLRGGTPTAAGLTTALDHLKTLDPDVPRAIVLVTDGAANCAAGAEPPGLFEAYDDGVHGLVADAFTVDGVPTYVVGVGIEDLTTPVAPDGNPDDTNTFDRLNDLATDGGKPRDDANEKFYNTVNQVELAAALSEIAADALTCIIPLETSLDTPAATAVEVDGTPVAPVTDCATEDGWVYTNPAGPFDAIELCGAACPGLKLVGEADIIVCMPG